MVTAWNHRSLEIARREGQAELLLELMASAWGRVDQADATRVHQAEVADLVRWGRMLMAGGSAMSVFREERARDRALREIPERFPDLPEYRHARLRSADCHRLEQWLERLPTATSADGVFALTCGDRLEDQGYERWSKQRLGGLPSWVLGRLEAAELDTLEEWAIALTTEPSLETRDSTVGLPAARTTPRRPARGWSP